jgi:hypothetical protein
MLQACLPLLRVVLRFVTRAYTYPAAHLTQLQHLYNILHTAQFEETADRDVASTHHALQAKSLHRLHAQHSGQQQRTAPLSSQSYHPPRSSYTAAAAARGIDRTRMLGSHSHHPPVSRFRGSSRPLSSHSEHSGGEAPQQQQQQHVNSDTVHYSGSSSATQQQQQQQAPELSGEHSEQQQQQQHNSSGNSSSSSSSAALAEAAVLRRLRAAAVDELSPEEALLELQELQNALPAPTATDTTAADTTTGATGTSTAAAMATSIGTPVPGCRGLKRLSSAQHLAGHVVVLGFPPRPSHMECFLRPLVQHRRHRPALVFVSAALAPLEAAFGRLVRTTGGELDLSDVYVLEVR